MSQRPLYAGREVQVRQRVSPPPAAYKTTGVQGDLAISVEANTVRRLQRGEAGKPAVAIEAAKATPAEAATAACARATVKGGQVRPLVERGSVIEQLAAATHVKSSRGPAADQAATRALSSPWSHGEGDQQLSRLTGGRPLSSLQLQDVIRMHLGKAPSNVGASATGLVDRRLLNDTLVFAAPERTQAGEENPVYTQLKSFRMPQGSIVASQAPSLHPPPSSESTGDKPAEAPSHAPTTAAPATQGTAIAPAVEGPPSAPVPAPPAGMSAPAVSPLPAGTDTRLATAVTGATATEKAPAPPTAPAAESAAAAPTNRPSAVGTGGSAAITASGATLPPQQVSARELTKEEVAEAEEERLLRDLIAASHPGRRSAWSPSSPLIDEGQAALPLARPSAGPTTDLDLVTAMENALQLRRETRGGALYGWRRPPENVLLPDPSQPAPTWTVLQSVPAQEAQQATARAAIARPAGGASADRAVSLGDGMTAAAPHTARGAANGHEVPQMPDCIDYHAPFQCVLRPEYVEHDLVPAALSAETVLDTGVDDSMASRHTIRTTTTAAAAAAPVQSGDAKVCAHASATATASGGAVKTMGAQAVILRDPLSLLACEHLAVDTMDINARRRAYLSAVETMHGITRGGALSSTRPGEPASMLQEASPPIEVFCELSYPAKVLLSAILYMRALGALPTLLRVGPLTEYSSVVGKENCIELVFYNPSREEGWQETQEEQPKRLRHSSVQELSADSTVFYDCVPAARISLLESAEPPDARGRSRSQRLRRGHRSQSCSPTINRARGSIADSFAGEGVARANPAHRHADASPSGRPSAVESRLMRTLSEAAMRRASSVTFESVGAGAAAVTSRTVSPRRFSPHASFTNLAGPQLRSAEISLMADDILDEALRSPGAGGGEPLRYESGGFPLQRNEPRSGQGTNADELPSGSDDEQSGCASPAHGRQHHQRPSQPRGTVRARPAVACVPRLRTTPSAGTSAKGASGAAASAAATAYSALRRSSVTVALEDLQQLAREYGGSATARAASAPFSSRHFFTDRMRLSSPARQPAKAMPRPLTRVEKSASTTTCGPRAGAALASGAKSASAYGPGDARFPRGGRELCVVLRAIVAQKSHVYSFGKAETVHVLPPLPSRSTDDDVDTTLPRDEALQKTAELERLAVGPSNPLFKLLSSDTKQRGEATIGAGQWKAALRDRARRVAAMARRSGSVLVDGQGKPTADDYGDLAVAFLLSGNASELSGSVPDIMELEALRYRIFSLLGYSASDPAGMQGMREAAARPPASSTQRPGRASVSLREPNRTSLQHHLDLFTAFRAPVSPHSKPNETSFMASPGSPRAPRLSILGTQRRPSFFESALRQTDPLGDLASGGDGRGHYLTEFDVQRRQKQQQQQSAQPLEPQALMRQRYPIYRASSVAESTLQVFFAEARAAVAAARKQTRRHGDAKSSSGRRSARSELLPSPSPSSDPMRHPCTEAAASVLQDAERDLLRFRPMNLNRFHRELTDAVQCALDVQMERGKESLQQAFHA
ncbi:hypothetical protein LSCM1_04126 [Leishmania martiniquensis]|uniref:Uncharacterized protein n=1 Tax=Leishmania martiniquensis TaxID=1580590 RepID=A0A836KJD7_9TRYP|nr:hypothetical protein LSCM1_04126 [Leishmania martiniquensis]